MKKIAFFFLFISNFLSAQTWQPLSSILVNTNNQRFDDVFFLNENLGWAANGFYAKVFKTIDGGANWVLQFEETPGNDLYFRNIEFLDENIGFLGTLNQKLYKTIDGGTTWNLITNISPNPLAICGLDCVGTSTVYGCGAWFSPANIIKSTDSGNTWQFIDMSAYANALIDINFIDENIGFVSGNSTTGGGIILKTTDGGATWTQLLSTGTDGDYVWKLQVLSSNNNVIFGSVEAAAPNPGKLAKSIDGGVTWTLQNAPETHIQAVGFLDENHGWMGGWYTGFYETFNGGTSWTNTGVGNNLNRIFFIGNTAYTSGTTIYKMSNTLSNPSFDKPKGNPLEVKISPNPLSDKLNIEINFLANDHILIDLYDSNGKLIKRLIRDEINSAGIKNYTFDFPYQSGTYYLDFHTNSGRQSAKIIKK